MGRFSVHLVGFLLLGTSSAMSTPAPSTAADLLAQGDALFAQREYLKAREPYLQAAAAAEKARETSNLVEAWAQVARTYLILNEGDQGRPWLEKAAAKATPKDPGGWSRYLGVRGRFEWQAKTEDQAVATFKEQYAFCVEHALHSRAVDAAHMLAIVGDLDAKIEWSLKGIKEAEAGDLTGWLPALWNNLGWNYDDKGEYDKALEALLKARDYHWRGTVEIPRLVADWGVGHAYRMVGKIDTAEAWLRPCLAWAERLAATGNAEAGEWVGSTCRELGECALARKDAKAAVEYLERAVKELRAAKMPEWDAEGFGKLQARLEEARR